MKETTIYFIVLSVFLFSYMFGVNYYFLTPETLAYRNNNHSPESIYSNAISDCIFAICIIGWLFKEYNEIKKFERGKR